MMSFNETENKNMFELRTLIQYYFNAILNF